MCKICVKTEIKTIKQYKTRTQVLHDSMVSSIECVDPLSPQMGASVGNLHNRHYEAVIGRLNPLDKAINSLPQNFTK